MPFNYLGDLYKSEIVVLLRQKGCEIKNVHELNLILEKMGLLIHSGNHWLTAKDAVKFRFNSKREFSSVCKGW